MRRHVFYAKIHRATVTHANLDYEGSVTIDSHLLDAADMHEHEMVHIWNVTRGTRLTTYALRGAPGSGHICINGAAAHGNRPGDLVIIASFVDMTTEEMRQHSPRVVFVNEKNQMVEQRKEVPGPNQAPEIPSRIAQLA